MFFRVIATSLRVCKTKYPVIYHCRHKTQQITVEPYCKIQIKTSSPIIVRPFDLLSNPAGNQIKATLAKDQTELDIDVKAEEGQQVVYINEKLTKYIGHDEILLEVPVQVDLAIENGETVSISDIESDSLEVYSMSGIRTKNIKGDEISLVSGGGIDCQGQILAKKLKVITQQEGVMF